jgi:uncharacterized phage protein gp47/JayE
MPLDRPSLPALVSRVLDDLDSALPGAGAKILRTKLNALGRILAGLAHGLYGFVEVALREALPDLAGADGLARWGTILGVTRDPATRATGSVDVTVTTPQTVAQDTELISSTGQIYRVSSATAVIAGVRQLPVTAVVAGAAGNLPAGATVSFVSPLAGIAPAGVVSSGDIDGGFDVEDVETWRGDILFRMADPPHGGTISDLEGWARDVGGVWKAWAKLTALYGFVDLWIVKTGTDVDPSDIEAPPQLVTDVQDYIDPADPNLGVAPVTMHVTVAAATVVAQALTISITPDTTDNRDALEAALESFFLANLTAKGTTITISRLERLAGAAIEEIAITSPGADIVVPLGSVVVLGAITWV